MTRTLWPGVALLLTLGLSGCGDPKHPSSLHGTWKLTDMKIGNNSLFSNPQARAALSQGGMTFTFEPKGAMKMAASGQGRSFNQEGTWEIDKDTLKATGMGGSPAVPQPRRGGQTAQGASQETVFKYQLENGDKTLTLTTSSPMGEIAMVLSKQ